MKFLQTGDWHLGKVFYGKSLYDDQICFLSQVTAELVRAKEDGAPYDALIVPGDIYDRAVPPAESVTALSGFLTDTRRAFPALHIFLLSGNHDSGDRLSFAKDILKEENIHLCTDTADIATPVIVKGIAVYQLPFLTPGSIRTDADGSPFAEPLRSQQDLLVAAVARIAASHRQHHAGQPALLCAHLFAAGSRTEPESERGYVGTADQVGTGSFDFFAYTALGHLHSFQRAGADAYYAGAPLCYSFGETNDDKCLLSAEIRGDGTYTVRQVPVRPLHPCAVIRDSMGALLTDDSYSIYKDAYVQAVCTDRDTVENPLAKLRPRFPYILSFVYDWQDGATAGNGSIAERRSVLAANEGDAREQIFTAFLRDIHGDAYLKEHEALIKDELALYKVYAGRCGGQEAL